jgi:hypothetical protein
MKNNTIQVLMRRASVVLVLGGLAVAVQANPVQAPPLPPGSGEVRVDAGINPDEVARHKRAHKHSHLEKKDATRDDSLADLPAVPGKPKGKVPVPKSKPQPTVR